MIIVVANSKGGVGKSTIAVHLAAWLHEQGHQVTLADCDTQHSSSDWLKEAVPEIKTVRLGSPDQILDELPAIAKEADYVVADGPGSNTETSRTLLLCAIWQSFRARPACWRSGPSNRPPWPSNTPIESGEAGRGPSSCSAW